MRFLVDQYLSVELAERLAADGHHAVHVASYGLSRADDEEVLDRAATEGRVLVSADTDFDGLLAARDGPYAPPATVSTAPTGTAPLTSATATSVSRA